MATRKKRAPGSSTEVASPPARDLRPWIYAAVDVLFAVVYVVLSRLIVRASTGSFGQIVVIVTTAAVLAALGVAVRRPWGWWASVLGSAAVLVTGLVMIVLLLLAAAYLRGVYGALGKGAAMGSLVAAAIIVELFAIWPALQLRYLLSRDGRLAARRTV